MKGAFKEWRNLNITSTTFPWQDTGDYFTHNPVQIILLAYKLWGPTLFLDERIRWKLLLKNAENHVSQAHLPYKQPSSSPYIQSAAKQQLPFKIHP